MGNFDILLLVFTISLFSLGLVLGWFVRGSAQHEADNSDWRAVFKYTEKEPHHKYREYWVWINDKTTQFRITYGIDNAMLQGDVPPSYIGSSDVALIQYIKETYIKHE